jgi:serine/threonine protein kinase
MLKTTWFVHSFETCSLFNSLITSQEKDALLLKKSFLLANEAQRIKKLLGRERYILWKLRHSNIVEFRGYEQSEDGSKGYLYMEFCQDGDFTRYVDPGDSALSPFDIWEILADISSALAYCHYGVLDEEADISLVLNWRPVIHRDIKPGNGQ